MAALVGRGDASGASDEPGQEPAPPVSDRDRAPEVSGRTAAAAVLDLGDLALDQGGHLLIMRALASLRPGERLLVRGSNPALRVQLRAWCRKQGVAAEGEMPGSESGSSVAGILVAGPESLGRWRGADPAGEADPTRPGAVVEHPPAHWGLAARGAMVEAGSPEFSFPLAEKDEVWADEAARIYAQAAAAQWDPETAVDWKASFDLPPEVEDAVVQVMTYLIENEEAALIVPARFLSQIHPHFREILQVLAIQAADEARHIEVFTRRALLRRSRLGLSTAGGQASLKTLLDEPDFGLAVFLLSVLGEGSFLSLLWFLRENAPDPVTAQVARLAAQDEARHVAFGLAHLGRQVGLDPGLRGRLAGAIERRHAALRHTAGLNEEVMDSLVLLAAGSWDPEHIRRGHEAVQGLQADMDDGRRRRLRRLGFSETDAAALSGLHTRNFM